MSQQLASTPCNLCQSRSVWVIGERDRHRKPLKTVLCQRCGLGWSDPQPGSEDLKRFYEKDYRLQYKGTFKPKKKHTYRAGRVALRRLEQLNKFLRPGSSLLDLGSGGGEFVFLMRKEEVDASGIEPNEGYASYAKNELGLPIQEGFISDQLHLDRKFDTITLFHVLEHLQDPLAMVALLKKQLKEGGHLIIEVPSLETTIHYSGNCYHFAHLYHFSGETLRFLGELNGLTAVSILYSDGNDNVTIVLKNEGNPQPKMHPHHAKKLLETLRGHTFIRHLLNPKTHLRALMKQFKQLKELVVVSRFSNQREALEEAIKR